MRTGWMSRRTAPARWHAVLPVRDGGQSRIRGSTGCPLPRHDLRLQPRRPGLVVVAVVEVGARGRPRVRSRDRRDEAQRDADVCLRVEAAEVEDDLAADDL